MCNTNDGCFDGRDDESDKIHLQTYRRYYIKDPAQVRLWFNSVEYRGIAEINERCAAISADGLVSPNLLARIFAPRGAKKAKIARRVQALLNNTSVSMGRPSYMSGDGEKVLAAKIHSKPVETAAMTLNWMRRATHEVSLAHPGSRRYEGEPSRAWCYGFLERHKLVVRTPDTLQRIRYIPPEYVRQWYDDMKPLLAESDLDPRLLFNMDETMIEARSGRKLKVIWDGEDGGRPVTPTENGTNAHITYVPFISADGLAFSTLILCSTVERYFTPGTIPPFLSVSNYKTPSGWMTRDVFEKIINDHFIPHVQMKRNMLGLQDSRAVLVTDGHVSRYNVSVLKNLSEKNISLVILVPHTTHVSQPLDVALFSPFKTKLREAYSATLSQPYGQPRDGEAEAQRYRRVMAVAIDDAVRATFKPLTILAGFRKAGIHPHDPTPVLSHNQFCEQHRRLMTPPRGVLPYSDVTSPESILLIDQLRPRLGAAAAATDQPEEVALAADIQRPAASSAAVTRHRKRAAAPSLLGDVVPAAGIQQPVALKAAVTCRRKRAAAPSLILDADPPADIQRPAASSAVVTRRRR